MTGTTTQPDDKTLPAASIPDDPLEYIYEQGRLAGKREILEKVARALRKAEGIPVDGNDQ